MVKRYEAPSRKRYEAIMRGSSKDAWCYEGTIERDGFGGHGDKLL